uniref:C-CAP/cofactor C-like domain-containing protein n=1 Tax=Heterorhabditis bacteriophora TaxID=37862 RepID=A0A1I7XSF4_HETBA
MNYIITLARFRHQWRNFCTTYVHLNNSKNTSPDIASNRFQIQDISKSSIPIEKRSLSRGLALNKFDKSAYTLQKKMVHYRNRGKCRPAIAFFENYDCCSDIDRCEAISSNSSTTLLNLSNIRVIGCHNANLIILFVTSVHHISINEELVSSGRLPLAAATIGHGKRLLSELAFLCNRTPISSAVCHIQAFTKIKYWSSYLYLFRVTSSLKRIFRRKSINEDMKNPRLTHYIAEHAHPSLQNHLSMVAVISRSSRSYAVGLRNSDIELAWATFICTKYSFTWFLHCICD